MGEPARILDTIDTAPAFTAADAAAMQNRFAGVAAPAMLRELLTGELAGRIASVSSYGAESAVLLHMVATIDPDVPVIFTNTQKMFGETLAYRDELVARLDAGGVPLFAITNFSHEFFPPFRAAEAGLFDRFRDIVVSGEEKLVKPDAAIYRLALDRFGLPAAGTVFIDDNAANVAGADSVGMTGILFTGVDDLLPRLRALGFPA